MIGYFFPAADLQMGTDYFLAAFGSTNLHLTLVFSFIYDAASAAGFSFLLHL